ncbi:MAG: pyrroline-5-carboxylate reductase family protein [Tangfeifania sp.]
MKTTIGFIGGGRITKIFLEGFKNKNIEFKTVKVYDHNAETMEALNNAYPEIEKAEKPEEVAESDVVVIAVHPPVVMETLDKIAGVVNEKIKP